MKMSLKNLLFAGFIILSNQIVAAEAGETLEESPMPGTPPDEAVTAPSVEGNIKFQKVQTELGEGLRFPTAGKHAACECTDGGRFLLNCEKACTGFGRGSWKKVDGKGLIQLTNRGFKCVCTGFNVNINCYSKVPKRCGTMCPCSNKTWSKKVIFKDAQGREAIFDAAINKVKLNSAQCPHKPLPN